MRSASIHEHEGQVLRRHGLPVHRRVFGRVGVGLPPTDDTIDGVLLGLHILRALEHHVLEEMRKACAAGFSSFEPT